MRPKYRRLTVPEVLPLFQAYLNMPGNYAWGSLHVVLEDGNYKDVFVEGCVEFARENGDKEGEYLALILLAMSQTQRSKISKKCHLKID